MARSKHGKQDRDGGAFLAVPMAVLNSSAYVSLSAHARMLLWDLAAQYRRDNNGDLCAAWKLMKPRGWKSEDTLHKAKVELLEAGLIAETRKGARPNKATLYGLTWFALDHCDGKLDIGPQAFPRGAYRQSEPLTIAKPKNASLATPVVVADSA